MKSETIQYNDSTDEELYVRASRHNDERAFTFLYKRYGKLVYGFCLRMLGRKEDAADALQSVFLQMMEKKDLFVGGSLRAWIFTLARNRCLNDLGKRKVRLPFSLPIDDDSYEEKLVEAENPQSIMENKETSLLLIEAISMLPRQLREVIEYRYIEEKSYEEISSLLNITVNHVRVLVFRAKKLLYVSIQS